MDDAVRKIVTSAVGPVPALVLGFAAVAAAVVAAPAAGVLDEEVLSLPQAAITAPPSSTTPPTLNRVRLSMPSTARARSSSLAEVSPENNRESAWRNPVIAWRCWLS